MANSSLLCVLLHSQRWFLHHVPLRSCWLAESVENLGLFQWGSMVSLGFLGRERAVAQTCVTVFPSSEPINTAAWCFYSPAQMGVWYHTLRWFMDQNFSVWELPCCRNICLCVVGLNFIVFPLQWGSFLETVHLFCSLQLNVRHRTLTSNIL